MKQLHSNAFFNPLGTFMKEGSIRYGKSQNLTMPNILLHRDNPVYIDGARAVVFKGFKTILMLELNIFWWQVATLAKSVLFKTASKQLPERQNGLWLGW